MEFLSPQVRFPGVRLLSPKVCALYFIIFILGAVVRVIQQYCVSLPFPCYMRGYTSPKSLKSSREYLKIKIRSIGILRQMRNVFQWFPF